MFDVWLSSNCTNSLDLYSYEITVVAGVGLGGSDAHMLQQPEGIFVDTDLNLYVADVKNHRIQFFRSGEINGLTIAGTVDTYVLFLPVNPFEAIQFF